MGKFTKNSGETRNEVGQVKKVWGDRHPGGGDTRVKAIKSDSDSDSDEQKKGRQVFQEKKLKNRGVTPLVAAPGVTHPSDATAWDLLILLYVTMLMI